jgi:hypothetical protein
MNERREKIERERERKEQKKKKEKLIMEFNAH